MNCRLNNTLNFQTILHDIFCNRNNKEYVYADTLKLIEMFEYMNNINSTIKINLKDRMNCKNWQCYCGWYHFGKNYIDIYSEACDNVVPNREIQIKNKNISRSVMGTLLHEYGHFLNEYFEIQIYGHGIKNDTSKLIDEMYIHVYNSSKKYKVLNYLFKPADPIEDFAETFIYFILNPNWLKRNYPYKYEFFINVLHLIPIHELSHNEVYKLTYEN